MHHRVLFFDQSITLSRRITAQVVSGGRAMLYLFMYDLNFEKPTTMQLLVFTMEITYPPPSHNNIKNENGGISLC